MNFDKINTTEKKFVLESLTPNPALKSLSVSIYLLFFCIFSLQGPAALAQPNKATGKTIVAFVGATVYPSPTDAVIRNGIVLTEGDKIVAVGKKRNVKVPKNATIINCKGMTITAGFWNSHVHLMDPKVADAAKLSDQELASYLQVFLTKYGFTYAFDIGSFSETANNIKHRIETTSVLGPLILTTGPPLAPDKGTPFYLKTINITLPELNSSGMASTIVNQYLSSGVDGIKIFAGSPAELGKDEIIMPLDIAKAVTKAAHGKNKSVFAHPSVNEGLQIVIASGVDILAHTTPDGGKPWDSTLINQIVANNIYVIPTLKLWKWSLLNNKQSQQQIEAFVAIAIEQVKELKAAGGRILFGTDIGFMDDFDPTEEYVYLQQAGLNFKDILATLTTTPSEKFGFSNQFGKIAVGMNADLVVFAGDPQLDIKVLADVKYTVRQGKMIYINK
jgi:imidazolonepropionase-like amidohydrolase